MMEQAEYTNVNLHNEGIQTSIETKPSERLNEERRKYEIELNSDASYRSKCKKQLPCLVYLFESLDGGIALVFHFRYLFFITIQGVLDGKKLINVERIGLPMESGKYYKLTESHIDCRPLDVVMKASKGNPLNSITLQPTDWIIQSLSSMALDSLAKLVMDRKFNTKPVEKPELEEYTWRQQAQDYLSHAKLPSIFSVSSSVNKDHNVKPLIAVEAKDFPSISSTPHVPSEYDSKERYADIIRYNNGSVWAVIFHFSGDDTWRTVKGVWDDNLLKPSFGKQRPNDDDNGIYIKLGCIKTSPKIIRSIVLENKFNGVQKDSGITEKDWAQMICCDIGIADKWDEGEPWSYVHPPQYTVAPNRLVFKLPSS